MEPANLIDTLAQSIAKHDENTQVVLRECGDEIGRFDTIAAAKHDLQHSYGEGQPLEWTREQDDKGRRLRHGLFTIEVVKKEVTV